MLPPGVWGPESTEKLAALDFADIVVLNKFDRAGAEDALIEIRKQFQRNREAFDESPESMPVIPTIASQFAMQGLIGYGRQSLRYQP